MGIVENVWEGGKENFGYSTEELELQFAEKRKRNRKIIML
jgi:hypothetical protein